MNKKTQTHSQYLKMPSLFREDLEGIEETLKMELNPRTYKLDLGSFEYQEMKEIPENTDSTNEFHIQTTSPYISIDFSKNSARIYTGDDDIKTIGVIKKITDIILKRERKFLFYLSEFAAWIAPAFFFGPIPILMGIDNKIKLNEIWFFVGTVVSVLSAVWWIISYQSSLKNFSKIEFVYKKNKPNFFLRNKDQIIVGIIIAVISVLGTIFMQKLFK